MLRLIIKSVGWVIHHLALFVGILCMLILLQTLGSIYENWAQISSTANPENPIEDLSNVLVGKALTNEDSDICKERETAIVAHRAVLDEEIGQLRSDYNDLYFYQLDKKLELELRLKNLESQLLMLNQAVSYLQTCQARADAQLTLNRCRALSDQCSAAIKQCRVIATSKPEECSSWERIVPPWPGICARQEDRSNLCKAEWENVCGLKLSICKLAEGGSEEPLDAFVPNTGWRPKSGSVSHCLTALSGEATDLDGQAIQAFAIVLSLIFAPFFVNVFVYFVLARLVDDKFHFRLAYIDTMSVTEAQTTRDVVDVEVANGQELLIKPEFIRNTSEGVQASTKFFLSTAFPFASLAAGLYMLTRFTGHESGRRIQLSESENAETKLSVVSLGPNDQVVISPRYIAGIVHSASSPVAISSKWLLTNPTAWLTGQLRVLVVTGPADLILRGCRGVLLQKVSKDVACQNDGVIGYTANLWVQHHRTETFWGFHRNKRELFNYRFSGAEGVVLQEVRPQRKTVNVSGWSLQRLGDLILNLFGI